MNNNSLYKNLDSYIRSSRKEFEDKLAELVEIPSVSSEPDKLKDIRRCGDVATQYLRDLGAKAEPIHTPAIPWFLVRWLETRKTQPFAFTTIWTLSPPILRNGTNRLSASTKPETVTKAAAPQMTKALR